MENTLVDIGLFTYNISGSSVSVNVNKEVESKLALPLFAKQLAKNLELLSNNAIKKYTVYNKFGIPGDIDLNMLISIHDREVSRFGGNILYNQGFKYEAV